MKTNITEQCRFKHFKVRFFVSINVLLCNSAILIKTSRLGNTSFWFQYCYKIIDIEINSAL